MTAGELKGIMSHELGHIVNNDPWNPDREENADRWAATHGYAKENISALKTGPQYPAGGGYMSSADRIKFFQRYLRRPLA